MRSEKSDSILLELYENARKINSLCCWLVFRASTCDPIFRFSTENTVSTFGLWPSHPLLSKLSACLLRRFPLILIFGREAARTGIAVLAPRASWAYS
jgi:hypothetical protein